MADPTNEKNPTIDLNPGIALEKIDSWLDGLVSMAPNLLIALAGIILTFVIANIVKRIVRSRASAIERDNLGAMLGGFAKAAIIVVGVLLSATIVLPTLKPGDLIAGLGVSSVAIGFAFKDILQNWLAGLLLLIRQPFEIDDQIEAGGHQGTVERIESRATIIRTYDGQRVVIPNSQIYTNSVLVKTAFDQRRSQYDIGIGYGDDLTQAKQVLTEALANVESILQDPAPQVLPWDLAASWVTLRLRWWTDIRRSSVVASRVEVIEAIKKALDDANIDMPYETRVQLFHDQTEDTDGDRASQREGWPSESDSGTTPRWVAQSKSSSEVTG